MQLEKSSVATEMLENCGSNIMWDFPFNYPCLSSQWVREGGDVLVGPQVLRCQVEFCHLVVISQQERQHVIFIENQQSAIPLHKNLVKSLLGGRGQHFVSDHWPNSPENRFFFWGEGSSWKNDISPFLLRCSFIFCAAHDLHGCTH